MLEEFAPSLYIADGPTVPFFGFPYPTRMVVARLSDESLWVWSPISLSPELKSAVDAIGPVRHIVSPNKIHHLFLKEWAERWPSARLYAPPGLAKRKSDLHFDTSLGDRPDAAWAADIDQTIFHGSFAMKEVVFFHRSSRTAIFGDLVQRHDRAEMKGFKGMLMWLDGLVGENGSTPREWRASFLCRRRARMARAQVLAWKPERLVIAHGACARENAAEIISRALAWL
jgi:hypothetical protein